MKYIKGLILITIVSTTLSLTQDSSRIYWHERNIITWNDFRPVQNIRGGWAALLSQGITRKCLGYNDANTLLYEIKAFIDKNESVYLKSKVTDNRLKHEQGHFDIAEIYARKIRRNLSNEVFGKDSVVLGVKNMYKKLYLRSQQYQNLYDKETNNSRNEEKQEEWDKLISKELSELEAYKDVFVECKVE